MDCPLSPARTIQMRNGLMREFKQLFFWLDRLSELVTMPIFVLECNFPDRSDGCVDDIPM